MGGVTALGFARHESSYHRYSFLCPSRKDDTQSRLSPEDAVLPEEEAILESRAAPVGVRG